MYRLETIDLGEYRGYEYFLTGFVDSDPTTAEAFDPAEDADSYGVSLARSTSLPLEANVEIVRLDTSHGHPHMDLLYVPEDLDRKRKLWLDDDVTYARMKDYLLVHWEDFVDRYIQLNE